NTIEYTFISIGIERTLCSIMYNYLSVLPFHQKTGSVIWQTPSYQALFNYAYIIPGVPPISGIRHQRLLQAGQLQQMLRFTVPYGWVVKKPFIYIHRHDYLLLIYKQLVHYVPLQI